MKIVYFFTFDYTLKTWLESGSLDRELEYFDYLNKKYGLSFILVTYGDKSDNQIIYNKFKFLIVSMFKYDRLTISIKKETENRREYDKGLNLVI